jgi:hypothetical protein
MMENTMSDSSTAKKHTFDRLQACEIGARHSTATQNGREFTEDGFIAAIGEIIAASGREQLVAALRDVVRPYGFADVAISNCARGTLDDFLELKNRITVALAAAEA